MYLLVIILKDEKSLKTLSTVMLECGFFDSTILDGEGIENIAGETSPLFNEITHFFGLELVYNRTVISAVPSKEDIRYFIKLCREEGLDFNDTEKAVLLALPVEFFSGNL